jgi:hypothetical protein
MLFDVRPQDLLVFASVSVALMLVAVAAVRIHPAIALRHE